MLTVDPDESTPLLQDDIQNNFHDEVYVQHQQGYDGGDEQDESPPVEELSTSKLLMVLSCVWIGVFLSALGEYLSS